MSDNPIIKAEGIDGQVALYDNMVKISRKGIWAMLAHGMKSDKDIIIKNIISIDYKKAGFGQGYFCVESMGMTDKKDYTVKFNNKKNQDFLNLKEQILKATNRN